jgi:DNA (cytosine-5)-methyltransferase 1
MENVPGILSMHKGGVVKKIKKMYNDIDYSCQVEKVRALDHGVPQKRKRVFFIGFKGNSKVIKLQRENGNKSHVVKDAISDILDTPPFRRRCRDEMTMDYMSPPKTNYQEYLRKNSRQLSYHFAPNHGKVVRERISHIKQGENHASLPKEYQLKSGYPNIYGRLHLDKPADTITGNCGCISAPGRFIHPIQDRAISVREAARLQSFPDDYAFKGSLNQKYKQVGNAVPPLMALSLAKSIKEML